MTNFRSRIFKGEPHFDSRWTLLVVCVTIGLSYLIPNLVGKLISNPKDSLAALARLRDSSNRVVADPDQSLASVDLRSLIPIRETWVRPDSAE
jgi:hypothetical protein